MASQKQRLITLDRWLRSHRRVVAKDAAKQLGVNERTIRRDLNQVLAGQWNLPLKYDRRKREWSYEGQASPLPATIIGDSDRFALLLSLQSIQQYRGTPIYKQLCGVYGRLLDLMPPETRTNYETLAKKIRFEGPPVPPISESIWNTLINALEDATTLQLTYRTGRSGEVNERSLDPYAMVVRHREWYLVGWDHLRKAVRTFLLPRIKSAEDTEERFRVKDSFDLDEYLATAVDGHQSTGPVHHVKLRFAKEASAIAEDYIWNATQKVTRDREGRIVVEFETGALYAVQRQVMGWGGTVEALEPAELREKIRSAAQAAATQHFGHLSSKCD